MKKKPTISSKRTAPAVPHPDDMAEAREAAESAARGEFLSASTSASIVASWLDEPRPKKKK